VSISESVGWSNFSISSLDLNSNSANKVSLQTKFSNLHGLFLRLADIGLQLDRFSLKVKGIVSLDLLLLF